MGKNVPKLRFKGFEGEWEEKKLGELCQLSSGSTPSKSKKEYFTGNIPWVTSGELKSKYLKKTIDNITEIAKKNTGLRLYDKGTLIIAMYGLEAQGTRGSSTILKIQSTISQACMALEPNNEISSEYLYYWYEKYGEIIGTKYAQGTKQQNLSTNLVGDLNIKMPLLQEQEKIANLLSKVDRYIELQEKKVSELEKYKKGMMQKIFSQKIRFRKDDGGEYPEWEEKRLGDVCTIYGRIGFRGYTVQDIVEKDKGVISLSPSNIVNSKLIINLDNTYISRFKYEESPEIKVFNGDILFVKTASIGRCALVKGLNEDATINPQLVVLKNIKISNKLLSEILLLPIIQQQVNKSKGGGVIPTLTQKEISSYKIFVPNSLEEQEKIAKFLSKVDLLIEKQRKRLDELKLWKKGLLQKMFV